MLKTLHIRWLAFLLVTVSCAGPSGTVLSRMTPVAPTGNHPTTIPTPPVPIKGELSLRSIVPAAGSALFVRWCDNSLGWSKPCTDDVVVSIDVTADQDLPVTNVRVDFWKDQKLCASGVSKNFALASGVSAQVAISSVQLGDGDGSFCALPATTTRVTLDSGFAAVPEYERSYTFDWAPRP